MTASRTQHEEQLAELSEVLTRLRPKVLEMEARLASSAVALTDAVGRIDRFTAACRSVAELHSPGGPGGYCITCGVLWPCATARELQGLLAR